MTLLIGAFTIGLILSLLALGVYLSFRVFNFPDITAEGSITLGAAVAATLLTRRVDPFLASAAGLLCGMLAGAATGVLHTKFKINGLLSGILVMTALYSINLHVMGKSNVPLLSERTLASEAEHYGARLLGQSGDLDIFGWAVGVREISILAAVFLFAAGTGLVLYLFFRTNLGTAMRATGDNPQMIRALGVSVDFILILGLAISNGLIALSGALLAQYQGFADVQMGIGMVVWGLASVIIGEALVGTTSLGLLITGAVMGSVLFRLLVAIALRWGLNPNDLKLITALFVFVSLIGPNVARRLGAKRAPGVKKQASNNAGA
jgi:putative ABC transport system permease protein